MEARKLCFDVNICCIISLHVSIFFIISSSTLMIFLMLSFNLEEMFILSNLKKIVRFVGSFNDKGR